MTSPTLFSWTVENFSSTTTGNNEAEFKDFDLPNYEKIGPKLRLNLYQTGRSNSSHKYTTIYAILLGSTETIELSCLLWLQDANGRKCCLTNGNIKWHQKRNLFWCQMSVSRDNYLLDPLYNLLPENKLTICCEVMSNCAEKLCSNLEHAKLSETFTDLLNNGDHSDVTLVVGERELSLHKSILSARSPVFHAIALMLANDLVEKRENRVQINDLSIEVAELLFNYIYTGKLPKMENQNYAVDELFVAFDKYQLEYANLTCEQFLGENLTIDLVTRVFTLADMHNADQLKKKCLQFINQNCAQVIETEDWKLLVKGRPDLLDELYRNLAKK